MLLASGIGQRHRPAASASGIGQRTSMRNQLPCRVLQCEPASPDDPMVWVQLRTPGGASLTASVYRESADLLGLAPGAGGAGTVQGHGGYRDQYKTKSAVVTGSSNTTHRFADVTQSC